MQMLELQVNKCNSTLDPTRPCANQSIIDGAMSFRGELYANIFYVNPLINPGSTEYLDYYIEDRNFIGFNNQIGASGVVPVQDYEIQTDESLLPFTEIHTDRGITIPEPFQIIPKTFYNNQYANFLLMKSPKQTNYIRSFNKIDQFFAYIGGLIGTILGFMLFMSNFSMMSFELDIAGKYFNYSQGEEINYSGFNVFHYIIYLIYKLGSFCGLCKSWKQMKKRVICKEQMLKQLDITLFLQRFNFLQRVTEYMIKTNMLSEKKFYQKETLKDLKERRRKYRRLQKKKDLDDKDNSDGSSSSEESQSNQSGLGHDKIKGDPLNINLPGGKLIKKVRNSARFKNGEGKGLELDQNADYSKDDLIPQNISFGNEYSFDLDSPDFDKNVVKVQPRKTKRSRQSIITEEQKEKEEEGKFDQ